jgi:outer membrane immunogenic protein
MGKLLLGATAAVMLASASAFAADLRPAPVYKSAPPFAPVYSWSGCYLGGNIGGATAYSRISDPTGFFAAGQNFGWQSAGSFIGGGQVGCDYQFGSWVVGGQGMFDWADLTATKLQPNGVFFNSAHIPWLTTATGRIGYTPIPTLLLYVKGGGAWARDNYSIFSGPNALLFASAQTTRTGWTVGAGFENRIYGNWSWFAEYDYLNFGTNSVTFATNAAPALFPINVKQDVSMFVLGLNYRLSPGVY